MEEIINLNIGGAKFSTTLETLKKLPNTRLCDLAIHIEKAAQNIKHNGITIHDLESMPENEIDVKEIKKSEFKSEKQDQPKAVLEYIKIEENEYFYDREPEVFRCVLNLYRTGHLHIPSYLCTPMVRTELKFWQIEEILIGPCCLSSYKKFDDAKVIIKEIENFFQEDVYKETSPDQHGSTSLRLRIAIWKFSTDPDSSAAAKVWLLIQWLIIIASFIIIALETIPATRVLIPTNETQIEDHEFDVLLQDKEFRINRTSINSALYFTDIAIMFFMLLELTIKFTCAPSKLKFLKSMSCIFDMLAVFPQFVTFLILFINPDLILENRVFETFFMVMWLCRLFRIGRFMVVMKKVSGFRIMCLSLKSSYKELALLVLCISFGMIIFSSLMFYAELQNPGTFDNIFIGLWWSIVTMTTVGYGDMAPESTYGYLVGGICTLSGIITTGLAIPIISNKFTKYYEYANMKVFWEKYQQVNFKKAIKNGVNDKIKPNHKLSEVLESLC
ncbi:unnamed protein product [Owenia fusiformis]|uniref:Uncharacterized protein n=1 Tax=Owenia fusiformis TaxID=6347 RepID=A0A8J1XJS1_OWEFU|nr:unnamed protein product [Owenia fusiformis]